jgi:hypothetical protein
MGIGMFNTMSNCDAATVACLTTFVDVLLEICALSCEPFDSRSLCMKHG